MRKEKRLNEACLREFVRSELQVLFEDVPGKVPSAAGKDIKGGAASERAAQLFSSNKQLVGLTNQIKDVNSFASFMQDVIKILITPDEKGNKKLTAKDALTSIKKIIEPLTQAVAKQQQEKQQSKKEEDKEKGEEANDKSTEKNKTPAVKKPLSI